MNESSQPEKYESNSTLPVPGSTYFNRLDIWRNMTFLEQNTVRKTLDQIQHVELGCCDFTGLTDYVY